MTEEIVPSLDDPLYTTSDVAKMFSVEEVQVRAWIKEGKMNGRKILGRWRVQRSEVIRVANKEYGDG